MTPERARDALLAHWREIWLLSTTSALLGWDEETHMPSGGAAHRGEQAAMLAGLIHDRVVDERVGDWARRASECDDDVARAHAWHALRAHERARKTPRALVEELKRVAALAQRAWVQARAEKSFARFEPLLTTTIRLKREAAQAVAAPGQEPWEALLDEFEPGARVADVVPLLDQLAVALVPLVQTATAAPRRPDPRILRRRFDVPTQQTLARMVAVAMGYDLERGRIDLTTHPFCTTPGAGDVRVSIRFAEDDFADGFSSIVHEVGHALYEQGVPSTLLGTPAGELSSMGLHESQSRLWENLVGRSESFWRYWLPVVRRMFPGIIDDVDDEAFIGAVNAVEPGPIRVGADEATYNLHIVVRVELERALIGGSLEARALPEAWNAAYRARLGITPADDAVGVLQDVHWAAGLFGYFPTYTLGNLYAAQLWSAARAALPALDDELAAGRTSSLLQWLRMNVHARAATAPAGRIVQDATGQALSIAPFVEHLRARLTRHGMLEGA